MNSLNFELSLIFSSKECYAEYYSSSYILFFQFIVAADQVKNVIEIPWQSFKFPTYLVFETSFWLLHQILIFNFCMFVLCTVSTLNNMLCLWVFGSEIRKGLFCPSLATLSSLSIKITVARLLWLQQTGVTLIKFIFLSVSFNFLITCFLIYKT